MRACLILAAAPLLGAAPATPVRPAAPMPVQSPYSDERCPETPMGLARARKQGERLGLRSFGDLPPAQTFMTVDRRVAGCAAPMTMREVKR